MPRGVGAGHSAAADSQDSKSPKPCPGAEAICPQLLGPLLPHLGQVTHPTLSDPGQEERVCFLGSQGRERAPEMVSTYSRAVGSHP